MWLLNSLKKWCFSTQEFNHFEIIPLSILGCDQQNLKKLFVRLQVVWAQVSTRICWWFVNSVTQTWKDWSCAICISRGLMWQSVCYLTISQLLFGTNCVFKITQDWSSNRFHHQWIGRQNKQSGIKCIPEWSRQRFFVKKCAVGQYF